MARATPQSLTANEQALVTETRAARLRELDEDALIELHGRVRRARDKFVQLHRREVGQQIEVAGARGLASTPPRRSASKAEIFEQALARVSASLARAARTHAAELRTERLAAARGQKRAASHAATTARPSRPRAAAGEGTPRARSRTPIERKTAAATRASGRRRQAAADRAAR